MRPGAKTCQSESDENRTRNLRIDSPVADSTSDAHTTTSESVSANDRSRDSRSTRIAPDLQHLITAWPDLTDAVKAGIKAMVQATAR